jgi:hypothetical protein
MIDLLIKFTSVNRNDVITIFVTIKVVMHIKIVHYISEYFVGKP